MIADGRGIRLEVSDAEEVGRFKSSSACQLVDRSTWPSCLPDSVYRRRFLRPNSPTVARTSTRHHPAGSAPTSTTSKEDEARLLSAPRLSAQTDLLSYLGASRWPAALDSPDLAHRPQMPRVTFLEAASTRAPGIALSRG